MTNYDDIFSYLTSGSVNGPELLDITVSPLQDIYVRLYSAIASAPLTANSISDGRADLVQSVLDLIDSSTTLPERLVDRLNNLFVQKTNLLDSSFSLPSGTTLSPEGLDRLNQVTRMVGTGSSTQLLAANNFSTNSSAIQSTLFDLSVIDDSQIVLDSSGSPITNVDGDPVVINDYQSLTDVFIDSTLSSFTVDFIDNENITGQLTQSILLSR